MSMTLATTWQPRGETLRFRKLYPFLATIYDHIVVIMPPQTHTGMLLSFRLYDKLEIVVVDNWVTGRYSALKYALNTSAEQIHYVDMDRLIRWAETHPLELQETVALIQETECLVIGRSKLAYKTHPQSLVQTEAMSNRVFSHILGRKLDLSAGSKGFHRKTAQFIINNSQPDRVFGTDAEWVILAKRGGFAVKSILVDGLDWESADRYSNQSADEETQKEAAAKYDADPGNWAYRLAVANEIIEVGIETLTRPLKSQL